jgi:hypothetical protein
MSSLNFNGPSLLLHDRDFQAGTGIRALMDGFTAVSVGNEVTDRSMIFVRVSLQGFLRTREERTLTNWKWIAPVAIRDGNLEASLLEATGCFRWLNLLRYSHNSPEIGRQIASANRDIWVCSPFDFPALQRIFRPQSVWK